MVTEIFGSKQKTFPSEQKPDNSGYGQNGFGGPSSDEPGKRTTSGFLPDNASAAPGDWQTRHVPAGQGVPTNPGTKGASKGGKVPLSTVRRANDAIIRPTR